jgi:protein SCO1/2
MIGGLAVGAISALALLPQVRQGLVGGSTTTGTAQVGGPFSLTDHTGRRVTAETYKGKVLVVFFGFTHCPDICPSGLQVVSAALDKLGPKAEDVVPLFVTLDPERDTPQQLALYLKSFHPRLVGLTGTAEETAAAARAYRVYFRKVADEKEPTQYTLDHTSIVYVMGRDGRYVSHATHATPVDRLAEQIAKAL